MAGNGIGANMIDTIFCVCMFLFLISCLDCLRRNIRSIASICMCLSIPPHFLRTLFLAHPQSITKAFCMLSPNLTLTNHTKLFNQSTDSPHWKLGFGEPLNGDKSLYHCSTGWIAQQQIDKLNEYWCFSSCQTAFQASVIRLEEAQHRNEVIQCQSTWCWWMIVAIATYW